MEFTFSELWPLIGVSASSIAGVVGFAFSIFNYLKAKHQAQLSNHSFHMNVLSLIRTWSADTIFYTQKAHLLLKQFDNIKNNDQEQLSQFRTQMNDLAINISIQIEKGRLIFANQDIGDGFGKEKHKAYQGYRPVIFEFLVLIHEMTKKYSTSTGNIDLIKISKDARLIENYHRMFLSEMVEILNTKNMLKNVEEITKIKFLGAGKTIEDYNVEEERNR